MTTGIFKYLDPATIVEHEQVWGKVDTDVTSYARLEKTLPVANIRDTPDAFGTDVSGFAVFNSPTKGKLFHDDQVVRRDYYDEVEALLREKIPGVKKVVIFDHTIRRNDPGSARQPVQQVHVDQTPKAAETRVRRHVPASEADDLLQRRYQLINVWRPISHPATDFPLAVVDWRSTSPRDLVEVKLLYPIRDRDQDDDDRGKEVLPDPAKARTTEGYEVKGETYGILHNDSHRLYYVKDMTPDEVMFIKCFDSMSEGQPRGKPGIAALTPHTAFVDPQTPEGTPARQSIEVRCLVFHND